MKINEILRFGVLFLPLLAFTACERSTTASSPAPGDPAAAGVTSGGTAGVSGVEMTDIEQAYLDTDVGSKVYFDFDSYEIRNDSAAILDQQAEWMMENPSVKVVIAGHCDARGSREYNLALGERRASAAKDYLVSKGVTSARLSTISYGKERPAAIGDTEAAYALNRRAVTEVER